MEETPKNKPKKRESNDVFLLGGKDLEMYRINRHLDRQGETVISKDLNWGAKVEDYDPEIKDLLEGGNTPIAIELAGASERPGVVDIDHHGDKSERPSSIAQVMKHIDKPMSFIDELVGANDSAYIPGMLAKFEEHRVEFEAKYGAEGFESRKSKLIDLIRRKDREMQGITPEDEAAALEGLNNIETTASGTKVVFITGEKPSPVTDRLFTSWPGGKENLIVVCNTAKPPEHIYYFGRGDVCKALKDTYKGWGGGAGYGDFNKNAFGGCVTSNPREIIEFVTEKLIEDRAAE